MAGKLAHALLGTASASATAGELRPLVSGDASAQGTRRAMREDLGRSAGAAHLGLSDDKLDEVLARILQDSREVLDAATSTRDGEMADLQRRRRQHQAGTAAALALGADMRRLCETEVVTVTRTCGHCGRLDDPYSGCSYGGSTDLPIFVQNRERKKTYTQRTGAD